MKKALFPAIFCLGAVLVAPSGFKANAGEGDIVAKTYLSKTKETTPIKYGVYVPLDKYNKGFSSFGSALEDISFQPKNKFLRLSNFSSAKGIKCSSVALLLDNMPVSSKVTVSFSYRFSEGQTPYKKDDTVFSFSLRNSVKSFTYEELEPQLFKDFSWKSASFDLDITDLSITSNQANLEYFFGNTSTATSLKNYFDIDNVQIVIFGNNYFKNGSFDSFEVPEESSYLVQEVNLSKDERDPFINLKLDKEEIALFDQNTESTPLYFSGDDYFEYYSPMNGSALRYITSYPLYQVYSSRDENSFLRIQNFGDMPEINTFNNYFFNNETNEKENIKETRLFKFSFSYRLYMNEDIKNKYLSSGDHLLTLSTRECSKNGSGFINVDELSFNEKGDSTWHTYNGYLNTSSITLTSYFQFTYLNKSKPEDGTIVDIDNFYISSYDEDKNAFYGNGTFDFDLDSNYHPLTGDNAANVFAKDSYSRDSFGTGATEQNDSLYLGNGSSLSIKINNVEPGAYRLSFDSVNEPNNLTIMLGGRQGITYNTSSPNVYFSSSQNEGSAVIYLLAGQPFDTLDLVNEGEGFETGNISFRRIASVNTNGGEYEAFKANCDALFNGVDPLKLSKVSYYTYLNYQTYFASYDTNSSQERLDDFYGELASAFASFKQKADLSALNAQIEESLLVYSQTSKTGENAYEYVKFEKILFEALNATDEDEQTYIDQLTLDLKAATEAIKGGK